MRKRNPDWALDEWLLSLEIFLNNGHLPYKEQMAYLKKHSELRQELGRLLGHDTSGSYRNPTGLWLNQMQLSYLRSGDRKGRVSAGAKRAWALFSQRPESLRKACDLIYANLHPFLRVSHHRDGLILPDLSFDTIHPEGFFLTQSHLSHDKPMMRDVVSGMVMKREKQDFILCSGCEKEFGGAQINRLHCHYSHKNQLGLIEDTMFDYSKYSLYCSECHAVVHERKPWINLREQLRSY